MFKIKSLNADIRTFTGQFRFNRDLYWTIKGSCIYDSDGNLKEICRNKIFVIIFGVKNIIKNTNKDKKGLLNIKCQNVKKTYPLMHNHYQN